MSLIRIEDFSYPGGWSTPDGSTPDGASRARWCCEQMEDSQVLFFEGIPFDLSSEDISFLLEQKDAKSSSRKNISFDPKTAAMNGVDNTPSSQQLQAVMSRYSAGVTGFLQRVLTPYADKWEQGKASYRTEEEQGRDLKTLKRNDLLHTDAFTTQPTNGGRILRCFSNINPAQPRVWNVAEPLPVLAKKFAAQVGFDQPKTPAKSGVLGVLQNALAKGKTPKEKDFVRSDYDSFMLRFHDFLKENQDFQANTPKEQIEFPPNSSWMCFTDSVPHAALSGRFALEQTFFIPQSALLDASKSPLRVLEGIAGRELTLAA